MKKRSIAMFVLLIMSLSISCLRINALVEDIVLTSANLSSNNENVDSLSADVIYDLALTGTITKQTAVIKIGDGFSFVENSEKTQSIEVRSDDKGQFKGSYKVVYNGPQTTLTLFDTQHHSLFNKDYGSVQSANGSDDLIVSRFEVDSSNNQTTFLTGEEVPLSVGLSLTQQSHNLSDFIIEVKISNAYLNPKALVASDLMGQNTKQVYNKGEWAYVEYSFSSLASGTSFDIPIRFETISKLTPDNAQVRVEATLYTKDKKEKLATASQIYQIKTQNITMVQKVSTDAGLIHQDNQVIDAGEFDGSNTQYITSDITKTKPIQYTFKFSITDSNQYNGSRSLESIVIIDDLPENAVFLATDNPDWDYDPMTHSATKTYSDANGFSIGTLDPNEFTLKLRYPGQAINSTHNNKVQVQVVPFNCGPNEPSQILSDSLSIKLKASKIAGTESLVDLKLGWVDQFQYYDYQAHRERQFAWRVSATNHANKTNETKVRINALNIRGLALDDRLSYTGLQFFDLDTRQGSVDVIIYYKDGNQETVSFDLGKQEANTLVFNNPLNVSYFEVNVDLKESLKQDTVFAFDILTVLKDTESPVCIDGKLNVLDNVVAVSADLSNNTRVSGSPSASIYFQELKPVVDFKKLGLRPGRNYFTDEVLNVSLNVYVDDFIAHENVVDANKIVDVLPSGIEYVNNSASLVVAEHVISDLKQNQGAIEPTIVYNYQNTGFTALIWDIKPFALDETTLTTLKCFNIDYQIKISQSTKPGINKMRTYLSWENENIGSPDDKTALDLYDLNNNGSTHDEIIGVSISMNYVPPKKLLIYQNVKGSENKVFVSSPAIGVGEVLENNEFEILLSNNSALDIQALTIIDILPQAQGTPLQLSGAVDVPTGFRVKYHFIDPSSSYLDASVKQGWQETVEDFSLVNAIKIELLPNSVFEHGASASIKIPVMISNTTKHSTNRFVNRYAVILGSKKELVISNSATLDINKYSVSGIAFLDDDKDGLFDFEAETRVSNQTVQLLDQSGKIMSETKTDAKGYYHFDVFNQNEYSISVKPTQGLICSTCERTTQAFTLNSTQLNRTENIGMHLDSSQITIDQLDIEIRKEWVNGPDLHPDISIQLYRDGLKYGDPITLSQGETEYTFAGLDKTDLFGNVYTYSIQEATVLEDYRFEVSGFVITNTYQPKTMNLSEKKDVLAGPSFPEEKVPMLANSGISEDTSPSFKLVCVGIGLFLIIISYKREKKVS